MRTGLLLALILFTGCASSRLVPRDAADEVLANAAPQVRRLNQQVDFRNVTLHFSDGRVEERVRHVVIGPTEAVYRVASGDVVRAPTEEVERITARRGVGFGGGALVGSVPGAGILMVGLLAPGDEGYGALVVMVGGAYAAAGALLGGLLGAAVVPKRERVLYEAPLDRYLAAPPEN